MENTDIIQSVTEAFSMQPSGFLVGGRVGIGTTIVKEIKMEKIAQTKFVVGYDENNNRLFEFRADAVNITFKSKES